MILGYIVRSRFLILTKKTEFEIGGQPTLAIMSQERGTGGCLFVGISIIPSKLSERNAGAHVHAVGYF